MAEFNWSKVNYVLGVSVMDDAHDEFINLYNKLMHADDHSFADLFTEFVTHMKNHFDEENMLMDETHFPATSEHKAEHQRVINELKYFKSKVDCNKFSFARFYIKDRIPLWFRLHLATMDSALAAHLKNQADSQVEKSA